MVVFELSQSDVAALKEALQSYTDIFEEGMEDMEGEELKNCQYELAHLKAIHTLMTRQRFQHLVEMCMARVWYGDFAEGTDQEFIDDFADDMGVEPVEVIQMFEECGFEVHEDEEEDEEDE